MMRPLSTCLTALTLMSGAATAQGLPDDLVRAELLPGWRTEGDTQMTALYLTLAPGWKTYWRSPGEAGIPPRFDWKGSVNVGAVTFHWPRPEIFDLGGYTTLGYHGQLVLPIEVRPADPKVPVALSAGIELGVCKEICVPVSITVAADLPRPGASDPLIRAALDAAPDRAKGTIRCAIEPIRDGLRVTATVSLPSLGEREFAVVEVPGHDLWVSEATLSRNGGTLSAVADLVPPTSGPFAFDRSTLMLTAFGPGGKAVEFRGCQG